MNREAIDKHIEINPEIMLGKPVIRNTRIPVYLIARFVRAGNSLEQIVDDYPNITIEDVKAAVEYHDILRSNIEARPLRMSGPKLN
jgi:uncharacterized protein (DUF433 family)